MNVKLSKRRIRGKTADLDPADLDPNDWSAFRDDAHRMLDDMIDYIKDIRDRPVWSRIPDDLRQTFAAPLPGTGQELSAVHAEFMKTVLPYSVGNVHPGFMGWVHGGGTAVGMVAEMVAAGLNANLGGRDHAPIEVERQVVRWAADLFGFPATASGLLVTGASLANFIAVLIARVATLGPEVRRSGVGDFPLVAYASTMVHGCVAKALDMAGLGTDALRLIPGDERADWCRRRWPKRSPWTETPAGPAVSGGGNRRHRQYRRHRRSVGPRAVLSPGRALVSYRRRHRCPWDVIANLTAPPRRPGRGRIPSPSISTNGDKFLTTPDASWCATARPRSALLLPRPLT